MVTYLVIGKGLFGSAAARYLSTESDSVVMVGPDEPANWADHDGVFASHYDEARIVSQSAPDDVWRALDLASIHAYETIEAQSGIRFFTPSGRLSAVAQEDDAPAYPYLPIDAGNSQAYTAATWPTHFEFQFPSDYAIVFEDAPSGYLHPRTMVKAQMTIARRQGTKVISQLVTQVKKRGTHVDVLLQNGQVLEAQKVLLTTGSFSNCFQLVPRKLAIRPESASVLLAEVGSDDAQRLKHLPPLNYKTATERPLHLSILPPLPYPDGRNYIKIVVNSDFDHVLSDFDALTDWFRRDNEFVYAAQVQETLQDLLPDCRFLSWQTKPCTVCYTPSGKPMIDYLDADESGSRQLFIAAGGNAGAAHSSDAIGKLAADLMLREAWPQEIEHDPFGLHFADEWREWMETPLMQCNRLSPRGLRQAQPTGG